MRELKFRAWHKINHEMMTDAFMNLSLFASIDMTFNHVSDIVVMQYTGLKDVAGKDIYEGDIVRLSDKRMPKDYREQTVAVTFENGYFMFGGFFPYGLEGQIVEIIGNIYEQPGLLKEDDHEQRD